MRERWAALKLWQKVLRVIGLISGVIVFAAIVGGVLATHNPPATPVASGSDIVVAIVGGVLLALALNRPRVNWRSGIDEWALRWRELGLSVFAFFSAGYAFAALYNILRGTLTATTSHVLLPAGTLMFVYLLIIHHEPFMQAGLFRGWCYAGVAAGTAFVGFALADLASGRTDSNDIWGTALGVVLFLVSVHAFSRGAKQRGDQAIASPVARQR